MPPTSQPYLPQQQPSSSAAFKGVFASLFTFCCFAIFLYPLISTFHVAADSNMAYWFARWPLVSLLVPPVFIAVWYVHFKSSSPNFIAIVVAIAIPFVVFMTIGAVLFAQSNSFITQLEKSCTTGEKTKPVEDSWVQARNFYACCLMKDGDSSMRQYCTQSNVQRAPTVSTIPRVLQQCNDYGYGVGSNKENWEYLQYMEETYGCTGFCQAGQKSLWTKQETTRDSCARTVAVVFKAKMKRIGLQLMIFSSVVLVLFIGWMFVASPAIREMQRGQGQPNPIMVKQ
jgi:hypothetical protein